MNNRKPDSYLIHRRGYVGFKIHMICRQICEFSFCQHIEQNDDCFACLLEDFRLIVGKFRAKLSPHRKYITWGIYTPHHFPYITFFYEYSVRTNLEWYSFCNIDMANSHNALRPWSSLNFEWVLKKYKLKNNDKNRSSWTRLHVHAIIGKQLCACNILSIHFPISMMFFCFFFF